MTDSATIERTDFAQQPLSFDSLRREGVALVQHYSGSIWTDYNVHDPGITILEQACYGLTDIIYRCDFAVADYLVDPSGHLDFARLGLELPQVILPCRPCTLADYHNAILDAVDELEQIWISPMTRGAGLYQMTLRPTTEAVKRLNSEPGYNNKLIGKVYQVYAKMRNLGEDIGQIEISSVAGYRLKAQVDIEADVDPVDILGKLYFESMQFLTGQLAVCGFEQLQSEGWSLAQILDGPATRHGRFAQGVVQSKDQHKHIEDLYTRLMALKGITRIDGLMLLDDQGNDCNSLQNPDISAMARLDLPEQQSEILVQLNRNGYPFTVPFEALKTRLSQRRFKQDSMRHAKQDLTTLYPMPVGEFRDFDYYQSIGDHFPPCYRLRESGISVRLEDIDRAQVSQLQGYLLLFDQFMANFGANISGINQLFSLDCQSQESYHFKLLDNHTIAGLERLYPANAEDKFEAILRRFDPFYDRKNRLLDYLLALYGETLNLKLVTDYNYYHDDAQLQTRVLCLKRDFLKSVALLGKDRGSGFNLAKIQMSPANVSGLQARLRYLLAMDNTQTWPYSDSLRHYHFNIVDDNRFREKVGSGHFVKVTEQSSLFSRSVDVPLRALDERSYQRKKAGIVDSFKVLNQGIMPQSLFSDGIDISRYKIAKLRNNRVYQLYFQFKQGKPGKHTWLILGSSVEIKVLVAWANMLRRLLIELNQQSEDCYLVEHLLLRPKDWQSEQGSGDFYWAQVSMILPGYSARCRDLGFRKDAEAIIMENCPVQVYPHIHWLEFEQMGQFEQLYLDWLNSRRLALFATDESELKGTKLAAWLKALRS